MVRPLALPGNRAPCLLAGMLLSLANNAAGSPAVSRELGDQMASTESEAEVSPSGGSPSGTDGAHPGFSSDWLAWSPPPECPGRDYIEDRIREWLGTEPPRSASLEVDARLLWKQENAWDVEVTVQLDGRVGVRHITVERCSDAADFVALAVALAVNPELAGSLPPGSETATREEEPTAPPSPFGEDPDEPQEEKREPPPEDKAPESEHSLALVLGTAGQLAVGPLPSPRGAVSALLGMNWQRWLLTLEASYFPEASETVPDATGPIDFSLATGRAQACFRVTQSLVSLAPCASVDVGMIRGEQISGHVSPPRSDELWAELAAGLQAELKLAPWIAPFALLQATVPLNRPRFVLDDGSLVHQPSVLGLRASLGLRFFLRLR